MIHRYRSGHAPATQASAPDAEALDQAIEQAPTLIDVALADFDFRRATAAVWNIVDEANRYINHIRPWDLAKTERTRNQHTSRDLDTVLATLLRTCQTIGEHLTPFLPDAATRITEQCTSLDGQLPAPSPLLRRLAVCVQIIRYGDRFRMDRSAWPSRGDMARHFPGASFSSGMRRSGAFLRAACHRPGCGGIAPGETVLWSVAALVARLRSFKKAKRWWHGLLRRQPALFTHRAWMTEF